ncbi:hypothetical protein ACIQXF_01855 [Lysinibacillus sp. NPDC097231]|uniref:hypothetical protein n=1 Tax=Lysinibacillus sp. NPDC097231 TaxID=3364142 RepID=UPI00382EB83B
MKKILVLMIFTVMTLIACSEEKADKVQIHELENFSTIKKGTEEISLNSNDIDVFRNAVKNAVKLNGIVNVVDPMYRFELEKESYFLWLNDQGGSIMNTNDTHTLYTLTDESFTQLKEILK